MSAPESVLRAAAIDAYYRFCAGQEFPAPPYTEERDGDSVRFVGTSPDGRTFWVGYEASPIDIDFGRPPSVCGAYQCSDQMLCPCGLAWDVNDPEPPRCPRGSR